MTPAIEVSESHETVRPLRVLVALIRKDLEEMREAVEALEQQWWEPIGQKLLEAKGQFERASEFYEWTHEQFDFGERQTQRYVAAVADETIRRGRRERSLEGHLRSIGYSVPPTTGKVRRSWQPDVDRIAEQARAAQERITRLHEDNLTRQQEREAERALALKLIDIGYRVLAKELHPDKGGSRDAMQRLGRVRDRLKQHA